MITIQLEGLDAVKRMVGDAGKQAQFALAKTITQTAKIVQADLVSDMQGTFDKPSPFTLRGTFSTSATVAKPEAIIGLKDKGMRVPPAVLLKEHFSGGSRGAKPMERALSSMGALPKGWRAVPGSGMPLDAYGNPRRANVREILGAISSRMKVYKGKGKRMQTVGYFVVPVGSKSHLHPGVYLQTGQSLRPVFIFVRSAAYRKVLDLSKSAVQIVNRDFSRLFDANFANALKTAR